MKPHDGLLAIALLIVALAAGCKEQPRQKDRGNGAKGRQTHTTQVQNDAAPSATATALESQNTEVAADTTTGQQDSEEPADSATEQLDRARQELQDLASEAEGLREAMLGATFKPTEQDKAQAGQQ
ncbi:MAG: hypothetical protein ACLFUJ_10680 [Phycisphaerae bacterium]